MHLASVSKYLTWYKISDRRCSVRKGVIRNLLTENLRATASTDKLKNLKSFFSNAQQKLRIKLQMKLIVDYIQHLQKQACYETLFLFIMDFGFFVFLNFE